MTVQLVRSAGEQPIYSIGAVAKMLGVPASTLRAWEQRYSLITPARSAGSQRLYSAVQVEQLRFIKARLGDGAGAADAHRLLAQHLADSPAQKPAEHYAQPGPTILIVERDPYAAAMTEHWLRIEGYQVIVLLGTAKAWSELEARPPEVVLIDLLVSGGAGYRCFARLRPAARLE